MIGGVFVRNKQRGVENEIGASVDRDGGPVVGVYRVPRAATRNG